MTNYQKIIDKYYPGGTRSRDIFMRHSQSVAQLALKINGSIPSPLDNRLVEAAAMLHDIGIFMTDAPGIECHGTAPYIAHGPIGAALLRKEGADERLARVAERHTGTGLSIAEFIRLCPEWESIRRFYDAPAADSLILRPESRLEQLVCYADKFYSKSGDMQQKTREAVIRSLKKFGPDSLARFEAMESSLFNL